MKFSRRSGVWGGLVHYAVQSAVEKFEAALIKFPFYIQIKVIGHRADVFERKR